MTARYAIACLLACAAAPASGAATTAHVAVSATVTGDCLVDAGDARPAGLAPSLRLRCNVEPIRVEWQPAGGGAADPAETAIAAPGGSRDPAALPTQPGAIGQLVVAIITY